MKNTYRICDKGLLSQDIVKNPTDYEKVKNTTEKWQSDRERQIHGKGNTKNPEKKIRGISKCKQVKKGYNELLCTHHPVSTITHILPVGIPNS